MTITTNNAQAALEKYFGWSEFKTGQAEVIERLLAGKSVLAVFPTGGGKSLCYQLPALMFDGLTVIVSPLIALMKDQIDQLLARGVCAVRLDSSLALDEYREAVNNIRSGKAKLLYVAPERFFNERFRSVLEGVKISLFAIDEAHCISQWGHNFRPDYLKLARITDQLNVQRILCVTATATLEVQSDIRGTFDIAQDDAICTEFYRPNLHIRSQIATAESRDRLLLDKLQNSPAGATIIYVTLQKTAERVAEQLQASGLEARGYHAGMTAEVRSEIQEWFMHGDNRIVVATIAFGMGIDKSDIRYVYHYNPPKSIESYSQEIGRAGRDGEVSRCEMIFVPEDRITLENFVFGDTPSLPSVESLVNEISQQPDEFFISPIKLGNRCDIRAIVLKTLMTYLELDGYLESTSPRYDSYSFKPNITGQELIGYFDGERQTFIRGLLSCSKKKKIWFSIDLEEAQRKLNCDRSRIVKALDYFGEKGWMELKVSGLVHGFRKLKPIQSPQQLAAELFEKIESRESAEISRTRESLALGAASECQAGLLSRHFGQPLEQPCGQCSFCLEEGPFEIPQPDSTELDASVISTIEQLAVQHPAALCTPRSIARFLCGIRSPSLTRAKLTSHASFGCSEKIPFDDIMQQVAARLHAGS